MMILLGHRLVFPCCPVNVVFYIAAFMFYVPFNYVAE